MTAGGGCQRGTGGRGLTEEESGGQCRPLPVHTDSDTLQPTVSYSPQILPVTLTPPAPASQPTECRPTDVHPRPAAAAAARRSTPLRLNL